MKQVSQNLNRAVVRKSIGIDNEVDSGTVELDNHIFDILYESQDVRSILEDECLQYFHYGHLNIHCITIMLHWGYSIASSFSKWTLNSPWKKYYSEACSDFSETGIVH